MSHTCVWNWCLRRHSICDALFQNIIYIRNGGVCDVWWYIFFYHTFIPVQCSMEDVMAKTNISGGTSFRCSRKSYMHSNWGPKVKQHIYGATRERCGIYYTEVLCQSRLYVTLHVSHFLDCAIVHSSYINVIFHTLLFTLHHSNYCSNFVVHLSKFVDS